MIFAFSSPECLHRLLTESTFETYSTRSQDESDRAPLDSLSPTELFVTKPTDKSMAKCCLSGLWLLHNFLDESHSISQAIHTAEGSLWHAIMHRMEGDFSNSKYWYRSAGPHPVFEILSERSGAIWDPDGFVDRCQQAARGGKSGETHEQAVLEWQALFEYCYRAAI